MDRIFRSWDLIQQSFSILRSDEELLWLPVFSAVAAGAASVLLLCAGILLFLPQLRALREAAGSQHGLPLTQGMWLWMFLFYMVNCSVVVFFNVALISTASDRIAGGHATINDGLQVAWERKGKILQWAFLAATVGILLRTLENRMSWLSRVSAGMIGVAWSLACFFVAPVLAAENLGPFEALQRSAELFRETWGEELTGGFSFGLIFTLLGIPGIAFIFFGGTWGRNGLVAGTVLAVIYWLLLAVVSAAAQGIFVAALYQYAKTKRALGGFNLDDFASAWHPKQ